MISSLYSIIENPTLFIISCSLLGLIVGSFLNVVIYRLPVMLAREWDQEIAETIQTTQDASDAGSKQEIFNLISPRSRCTQCEKTVTAWQNIPLLSYLFLRGKCYYCKTRIAYRYPLVEAFTAAMSGFIAWHFYPSISTVFMALLLTWALIILTNIDYDTYLLPDNITLPLIWLGLIVNYFNLITSLENALWGAIAGYLSLWLVFWAFKLVTGKEGIGYGDFKLLAALGAWLGWHMLPIIIIISSLLGALFGIGLIILTDHAKTKPIPFGPYLAVAGWIALIWGDELNALYLSFSGLA